MPKNLDSYVQILSHAKNAIGGSNHDSIHFLFGLKRVLQHQGGLPSAGNGQREPEKKLRKVWRQA